MKCRYYAPIFYNEENGYTVAVYETEEDVPKYSQTGKNGDIVQFVAVGNELPQNEGIEISLTGKWKDSEKYGKQYHVESYQIHMPTTKEGVKAYLASGLIKGIGPVTAERIVQQFGKHTFYVLDKCPERMLEIPGISEKKLNDIVNGYRKSENIRQLSVLLSSAGVTPRKLEMIHKHFGNAAVSIVKKDPFRLCEIDGFGFITVDPIARKLKSFKPDNPLRLKAAILYVLQEAETDGHLYLEVPEILSQAEQLLYRKGGRADVTERKIRDAGNSLIGKGKPLVCSYNRIYIRKNYEAEQDAAALLFQLNQIEVPQQNVGDLIARLEKREGIQLAPRQKKGIEAAFSNTISIITGGPGSGKTTILRFIVMIQEMLDMDKMILLAAPTGRARQRMYETTGYPAMTIHRSIGMTGSAGEDAWNKGQYLQDDLIIIDECSMVDMHLFTKFLKRVKKGSRLIFVGDKDQLESVGPGDVFRELIDSRVFPVTVLDQCFRQESRTILENAMKINRGNPNLQYDECFKFVAAQNSEQAAKKIQKIFSVEWEKSKKSANAVQVLSPLNDEAEMLNRKIRDVINPPVYGNKEIMNGGRTFRVKDKVMQTKNNDEVSNGDIGIVSRIYQKAGVKQMDVVFGEDRVMSYRENEHWELTHAYAITAYKGQGSEYDTVIIPILSSHRRMLKRNLYYTAVTRAKSKVILVGSKQALSEMIRKGKGKKRNTILGLRLWKAYAPLREKRRREKHWNRNAA